RRFCTAAIADTRLMGGLVHAISKGAAMRASSFFTVAARLALLLAASLASPASAECDTLAFEVNDYGKEGPTRDALALLDKRIVASMAKRGVTKYRVGEKTVNCSLFLDFIVFDEHTCIAQAPVCWGKD